MAIQITPNEGYMATRKVTNFREERKKALEAQIKTLNSEQKSAFDAILKGDRNIFLTGYAGSGKSYLTKLAISWLRTVEHKNVAVCSSTATSALLIGEGAVTCHSLFKFPPTELINENGKPYCRASKALCACQYIIVDEVSMIRSDCMESIYASLQKINQTRKKAGVTPCILVLIGDPIQLPPILTEQSRKVLDSRGFTYGEWFFEAPNFLSFDFEYHVLHEVKRQDGDSELTTHLNLIRDGDISDYMWWNDDKNLGKDDRAIKIFPRNDQVRAENARMLSQMPGQEKVFRAELHGDIKQKTVEDYGLDYELRLKPGCRVLFKMNPSEYSKCFLMSSNYPKSQYSDFFCNGSFGTYMGYGEDSNGEYLNIEIDGNHEFVKVYRNRYHKQIVVKSGDVLKTTNSSNDYFDMFCVSLGYATSIHKSQGCTFDRVEICGHGMFSSGQLYVALSRVKNIEGLSLSDMIQPSDIIIDPKCQQFWEYAKAMSIQGRKKAS